jgi:hypothetical protein
MYYAVYTAADVAASAQLLGGAASVRQLQPVVPQSAADVQEGMTYFVTDVSSLSPGPEAALRAKRGVCWRASPIWCCAALQHSATCSAYATPEQNPLLWSSPNPSFRLPLPPYASAEPASSGRQAQQLHSCGADQHRSSLGLCRRRQRRPRAHARGDHGAMGSQCTHHG